MNRFNYLVLSFLLALTLSAFVFPAKTQAQAADTGNPIVTLPDYTGTANEGSKDAIGAVQERLGKMLATAFQALAVLSLLPIAVGGIQLITSQGNSDQVDKGKKTLFWGVVGLVLALSGVAIFSVLLNVLTQ